MAEERSLIGQELVGFRLESELGEGGMAVVYRGVNLLDPGIARAIKVVHPELAGRREFAARFAKEAKILEELTHANVVRFYGVRREGSWLVMELELLEGQSFAAMLAGFRAAKKRAPIGEVVEIVRQASEGVAAAHALGVVHRDLKPENLFVTTAGTTKVLDFGIARALDEADRATRVTKEGAVPGSPAYMAPEVCNMADPSPASDVYALGLVLYEALSGEHPFDPPGKRASAMQLMYAQVHEPLPPLKERRPEVPDALAAVVERATAKDPKERYSSARELADALRSVGLAKRVGGTKKTTGGSETSLTEFELPPLGPSEEEEKRPTRVEEMPAPKGRGRLVIAVGAASAVVIAGLAVAANWRSAAEDVDTPSGNAMSESASPVATSAPAASTTASASAVASFAPTASECPEGMLLIPKGRFSMGSEDGDSDEKPVHDVDVDAFCMDETEVTVRAYAACVTKGKCKAASTAWNSCNGTRSDRQDHPVNCVNWNEADAYCKAVDKRLPTEEEWEYAARGTDGRKYPWGNEPPDSTRLNMAGQSDGWENTAPVKSFPSGKSPFGLYDMAGNVWEWTASGHSENYSKNRTTRSCVIRGGCWSFSDASVVRAADRVRYSPTSRSDCLGFRCAKTRP